jgi:hypothetical protein
MLIPKEKLRDVYEHIKHKVQAAEGAVLICVAGETDAIAGCHILTVARLHQLRPRASASALSPPPAPCCCCAARLAANHPSAHGASAPRAW